MSRGKMCAQAGHATAYAMLGSKKKDVEEWVDDNQVKIILAVNSEEELEEIIAEAEERKLPIFPVHDAGSTEVKPDTLTCASLGIASSRRVDKFTKGYKALR